MSHSWDAAASEISGVPGFGAVLLGLLVAVAETQHGGGRRGRAGGGGA
ncbi:hypothetical protein [Nocardia brasiliensis]|nr:hypothetical protein [Nocardia brasiliensis]